MNGQFRVLYNHPPVQSVNESNYFHIAGLETSNQIAVMFLYKIVSVYVKITTVWLGLISKEYCCRKWKFAIVLEWEPIILTILLYVKSRSSRLRNSSYRARSTYDLFQTSYTVHGRVDIYNIRVNLCGGGGGGGLISLFVHFKGT